MTLDERPDPTTAPHGRPTGSRWFREERGGALRAPLAAAAVITAAAHVPVTGEHLSEAFYIGALFIALEVASVLLAIALLRPSRSVYVAISIVGALAVIAFVVSRSVGLPLIQDDIGNWTEPLAEVSVAAELVMAIGGAYAAFRASRASRPANLVGLTAGVLLLAVGCTLTVVAADAEASAGPDMSTSSGTGS